MKSLLLYGVTGSWKTSNVGECITFLCERYGGYVRGIYSDNYGPIQSFINSGQLSLWDIRAMPDPLACCILASEGWWPEYIVNGVPTNKDGDPNKAKLIKGDFKDVAGYVIEGLKENADIFHRMMERKRQATGEPLAGEHSASAYQQAVQYAVSSRGTYGFAQSQTHRYMKLGFLGLPVPWVIATSHEYAKKAEGIYGVAVSGKSLAKVVPQWFDNSLHLEKVTLDERIVVNKKEISAPRDGSRAWFVSHAIDNVRWPAKLGVEPWQMPEVYDKWPMGYIPLLTTGKGEDWRYTSSVRNLLELIDPGPVVEEGERT